MTKLFSIVVVPFFFFFLSVQKRFLQQALNTSLCILPVQKEAEIICQTLERNPCLMCCRRLGQSDYILSTQRKDSPKCMGRHFGGWPEGGPSAKVWLEIRFGKYGP